jgi:hypothetical protein
LNDLNNLNERLARSADQKARIAKLENRLAELSREYRELEAKVRELQSAASRAESQVQRLEGGGLSGLFASVLGNKEEQIQKERQEALAAHLKRDEMSRRMEAVSQEADRVRAELAEVQHGTDSYESLMREKEQLMQRSATQGGAQLFRFGEQEQQVQWQVRELTEAYTAGQRADAALAQVENCLQSAQGWGTWDMLGGGLIATAVKHSRIDEARRFVHAAQQALAAYQRELKDVAMVIQVNQVQIGGFATFADFFFDGLIADWIVQSRINDSLNSARRSRQQVYQIQTIVYQKLQQAHAQLQTLQQQKAAFVASFQG